MFTITIDTANAAFEENHGEVGRILRRVATWADDQDGQPGTTTLRDMNGNAVGTATWSES